MLTINNAKYLSTTLITTTIIGLCASIGAFIAMIIKQYLGYGVYTNPISCTSTGTNNYAVLKYAQSNYINSSDAGQVVAIIGGTVALVVLISFRAKLPPPVEDKQQLQQLHWSHKMHYTLYILYAVSSTGLVIPTGYFISFIVELTSSKICSYSVYFQWVIVAILSGVALSIYIFNIVYLARISYQGTETQKENKVEEQKKVEEKKQQANENKEAKQTEAIAEKQKEGQVKQEVPFFYQPESFQNQTFKQEPLENHLLNTSTNQQMKEPLLPRNPSRAKFSEDQYQRLQEMRRLRREEEERIWELERKKRMLELEARQNTGTNVNQVVEQKPKTQSQKDKANGNQTIINIHLASSQPNNQPVVVQQVGKQQAKREEPIEKAKNKPKKHVRSRGTIYEESSQEESEKRYFKKDKNRRHDYQDQRGRYYTNSRSFKPQQFNPTYPKVQINPPEKRLSLSHIHSVQITPSLQSPKAVTQNIEVNQQVHSRILTPPNHIEISKNEESFFRKLLQQSQVRQRKIPEFKAPMKQMKTRTIKRTSEQKKGLDEYFQALNVSMMHMRSAYEQEYVSQKSNYSSVLSNKQFGAIPSESNDRNRLNSILNRQKTGNNPKTLSLTQIQEKIQKKYKNMS